jgi:lysophospholipase L1-like esterase
LFKYVIILPVLLFTCLSSINCGKSNGSTILYPDSTAFIKYQLDWQKSFYQKRIKEFKNNPIGNNKIVFLGNSITYGMRRWDRRLDAGNIVNRGISGDYSEGILKRLEEIIYYKPIAVFLLVGINDFFDDNISRPERTPEYVANNILLAAKTIKDRSPKTKVYIQTILPINNQQYLDDKPHYQFLYPEYPSINNQINRTNEIISKNNDFEIIDINSHFLNKDRKMRRELSRDGLHLNERGYHEWITILKPFVDSVNK